MVHKQSHYEYIQKLQKWRDRYETFLDSRPTRPSLDSLSHYLTEFQYSKVDEIEVPGQYTEVRRLFPLPFYTNLLRGQDKDSNQNFVRIQRLDSKFEYMRANGYCWRRITIIGSDNSRTAFTVQNPYHRSFRREERVAQMFRTFNGYVVQLGRAFSFVDYDITVSSRGRKRVGSAICSSIFQRRSPSVPPCASIRVTRPMSSGQTYSISIVRRLAIRGKIQFFMSEKRSGRPFATSDRRLGVRYAISFGLEGHYLHLL